MSIYRQGHCVSCDKKSKLRRNKTSNLLHLVLSVITLGFWLPVWLLIGYKTIKDWQCDECGSKDVV